MFNSILNAVRNNTLEPIEQTKEGKKALQLIKEGKNVFIHGKSGTGKSTFITSLRNILEKSGKNVVVVSPTAVSALNVRGQTIHSFFRINPSNIYEDLTFPVKRDLRTKWQDIDVIIFDEISMVRSDLFDRVNMRLQTNLETSSIFGGKQIVAVGDLYQLPPVVDTDSDLKQDLIFAEQYKTPYVFGAKCFNELTFQHVIFTKVFRQKNLTFVKHLSALQDKSDSTFNEALTFFNQRVSATRPKDAVCLCAKRMDAQIINEEELNKIPGEEVQIYAYHSNINPNDWKEKNCPADHCLKLKIGAKVMIIKNDDSPQKQYINGTVGYIESFVIGEQDEITAIEIKTSARVVQLKRSTWYKMKLNENGKQVEDEKRYFSQFPVQLAWATTIHKAQGMTFENTYVDFGNNGAFSVGQTYVALSRVTDIKGLFLKRPITSKDILIDKEIDNFFLSIGYLAGAGFAY